MWPLSATLLAVLVSCLTAVSGQRRSSCVERLFDEVVTCFSAQGLSLTVEPGQQDATHLMREAQAMDPAVQCRDKEMYKAAISCSLTSLQQCLDTVGMGGAIPDPGKFQQGMDVICERQQEFDSQCLKTHYHNILSCGQETVKAVVHENNRELSMGDIICISADVNYDCATKHLKSCNNHTLDIYLEQLDKYQVPTACINKSPGRANRRKYTIRGDRDSHSASTVFIPSAAVVSLGFYLVLHVVHGFV